MDSKGHIYNETQIQSMEKAARSGSQTAAVTLKSLEPLTRDEAAFLADLPPHERKAALAAMREASEEASDE